MKEITSVGSVKPEASVVLLKQSALRAHAKKGANGRPTVELPLLFPGTGSGRPIKPEGANSYTDCASCHSQGRRSGDAGEGVRVSRSSSFEPGSVGAR